MFPYAVPRNSDPPVTVPESVPPFRERVGGRWVISLQTFTLGATVNSLLSALTGGSLGAELVAPADIARCLTVGGGVSRGRCLRAHLEQHG
jgi:hypothetical protein